MNDNSTWPVIAAIVAGGAVARGRRAAAADGPEPVDMWKAGQLLTLAAEWIRSGDPTAAQQLLNLIPDEAWQFGHDEVVAPSTEPRIAAMATRLTTSDFQNSPRDSPAAADRMAQVETLNAIAAAIRTRMKPQR